MDKFLSLKCSGSRVTAALIFFAISLAVVMGGVWIKYTTTIEGILIGISMFGIWFVAVFLLGLILMAIILLVAQTIQWAWGVLRE